MSEMQGYLDRFRRRLRIRDGWLLAQRTVWLGLLAASLIAIFGRLVPVEGLLFWTLAPLAVWLAGVLAYSLLRPLPDPKVAGRVDLELGLKERLSTSLALEQAQSLLPVAGVLVSPILVDRQRQDALQKAAAIEPGKAFPLQILRRPVMVAGLLAALVAALLVLPNPMDTVLAEREAIRQEAEQQAQELEELRDELAASEELSPEEREELLRQGVTIHDTASGPVWERSDDDAN